MTTALKLPSIIASRYVPLRLIAKGGMGAVYEVEHARTGEHLALKVLLSSMGSSPADLERFKREARASARIKSEHVVHVIDADIAPELDGAPFLVMELLEGADLEQVAASAPALLSPAVVVDWLRQVARALDKAHRLGIVHRDLKPENLFLATAEARPDIVKVLDFGIVKMIQEGSGATDSGQILGTPRYMAPEQASTNGRVTPATDCYALGMVAYRLLTGETYYKGDVLSVLGQLLHETLQPPSRRHPTFAGAFDDWFMRACHRDPAQRFASAGQQIEALSEAFALPTVALASARETERLPRDARRRRALAAALLVVTGLAMVVAAMALNRHRRDGGSPTPSTASSFPAAPSVTRVPVSALTPTVPPPLPSSNSSPAPAAPVRNAEKVRIRRPHPAGAPHNVRPGTPPAVQTVATPETPKTVDPYADQK